MRVDASVLTALIFVGAGMGAGWMIKSGTLPVAIFFGGTSEAEPEERPTLPWPPQIGETYPDIEMMGLDGAPLRISDFRGKIILVEPVAMASKACQSFSGANEKGVFGLDQGAGKLDGLGALEEYVERFAGVTFDDPRVVYIQVLCFDLKSQRPPTLEKARAWAEHFGLGQANRLVAAPSDRYVSEETRKMIPSFHLIDADGVLRSDAGKKPRQDLYRELLPLMKELLEGIGAADAVVDAPQVTE